MPVADKSTDPRQPLFVVEVAELIEMVPPPEHETTGLEAPAKVLTVNE